MDTSTKYLASITPEQKSELLEFLKSHPELINGKFTKDFSFKKARCLWESLANTLNAIPGAKKDWKKWRKTWHDMKTRTKSKYSKLKQNRLRTGGAPPINIEMTKDDEQSLGIMGSAEVEGLQRLEKTISATEALAEHTERDIDIRDNYYTEKLQLMKEDIAVKARIAAALESIAETIKEIV